MRYLLLLGIMIMCFPAAISAQEQKVDVTKRSNVYHYELENLVGEKVRFEQFKGKYVFIEIWSMSCAPCLREMPFFHQLAKEFSDKPIQFIAVCVENNHNLWKDFVAQRKIEGVQWRTEIFSPFLKQNNLISVPRFVLLDPEGNILWRKAEHPSNPELAKKLGDILI